MQFDEKINYAHTFEEKPVLLWCNKNEINDEIIGRKEIDIYRKFKFFIKKYSKISVFLATLICLCRTLTSLRTVTPRS